jgi:hypothetical protein
MSSTPLSARATPSMVSKSANAAWISRRWAAVSAAPWSQGVRHYATRLRIAWRAQFTAADHALETGAQRCRVALSASAVFDQRRGPTIEGRRGAFESERTRICANCGQRNKAT